MTGSKFLAAAVILTVPVVLSGTSAQAFTARQATAQGQGLFVTSSGAPQNIVPSAPLDQPGNNNTRRPLRSDHHDRYFAGF